MSDEQFKALFQFLNWRDMFAWFETGHEKTLIYHTAVLVARKVKILPSNPLVVVVSPLNALISDQPESCLRLKLKAVEISGSRLTIVSLAAVFTLVMQRSSALRDETQIGCEGGYSSTTIH